MIFRSYFIYYYVRIFFFSLLELGFCFYVVFKDFKVLFITLDDNKIQRNVNYFVILFFFIVFQLYCFKCNKVVVLNGIDREMSIIF